MCLLKLIVVNTQDANYWQLENSRKQSISFSFLLFLFQAEREEIYKQQRQPTCWQGMQKKELKTKKSSRIP